MSPILISPSFRNVIVAQSTKTNMHANLQHSRKIDGGLTDPL